MSLALILAGAVLVTAGVRDSQGDLFTLVKGDLTGPNNYLQWALALVLIGAIGYIPGAKPFSVALLALVLLAIFLRKGTGFFEGISQAAGLEVSK